jgi:hypothetical protein
MFETTVLGLGSRFYLDKCTQSFCVYNGLIILTDVNFTERKCIFAVFDGEPSKNGCRFTYVSNINCIGEGGYRFDFSADIVFELCVFVGNVCQNGEDYGFAWFEGKYIWIRRSLFYNNTGYMFSRRYDDILFSVWQCQFDDPVEGHMYESSGDFEMVDIVMSFVNTMTFRSTFWHSCHAWYLQPNGAARTATGSLSRPFCYEVAFSFGDGDWSPTGTHQTGIRETTDQRNACGILRRCTFLDLNSNDKDGGAVYFVGVATSSLDFCDCQFTSCRATSQSETGYRGGAIYTKSSRANLIRVCGSFCYAYSGSFIASLSNWSEIIDISIENCSSMQVSLPGGTTVYGSVQLANTNFSQCRHRTFSACAESGDYSHDPSPIYSRFVISI